MFSPHPVSYRFPLLVLLLLAASPFAFCQKQYTSERDVFLIKEIVFYGYDYSYFRLVEEKRDDDPNMTQVLAGWNQFCVEHNDDKRLKNWFSKEKVLFNLEPTDWMLTSLSNDSIVSTHKRFMTQAEIEQQVRLYPLVEKEGIGHVVLVEYFDKVSEISCAYFVFFDIASRRLLMSDKYMGKEADGFGLVNFWGTALVHTYAKYTNNIYKRRAKRYIR